jgi:hypothetical protein
MSLWVCIGDGVASSDAVMLLHPVDSGKLSENSLAASITALIAPPRFSRNESAVANNPPPRWLVRPLNAHFRLVDGSHPSRSRSVTTEASRRVNAKAIVWH